MSTCSLELQARRIGVSTKDCANDERGAQQRRGIVSQSAEPLANFSATEVCSVFFEKIFQCRIIEHGFGQ